MIDPKSDSQENQQAYTPEDPEGIAPDSETQSSADSAQGKHNNPVIRQEETGGTTQNDQAEGPADL